MCNTHIHTRTNDKSATITCSTWCRCCHSCHHCRRCCLSFRKENITTAAASLAAADVAVTCNCVSVLFCALENLQRIRTVNILRRESESAKASLCLCVADFWLFNKCMVKVVVFVFCSWILYRIVVVVVVTVGRFRTTFY